MKKNIFLILVLFLIFSCKKETNIGYDVLPDSDSVKVSVFGKSHLFSYTYKTDSVESSGGTLALIGSYKDPIFGKAKSEFVTQLVTPYLSTWGDSVVIDSIYLYLRYDTTYTFYGNSTVPQTISIHEVTTDLKDTNYFSNYSMAGRYETQALTTHNYLASVRDSLLRIKLPDSFAEKIISIPTDSLREQSSFRRYIKGFYFKTEFQDAAIVYFNLASEHSVVRLYYHASGFRKREVDFILYYQYNKHFNLFSHDFSTAVFGNQLQNPESQEDSLVYVQSMCGVRTKIKIDSAIISELKSLGNITINKAELRIQVFDELSARTYPIPPTLMLLRIDKKNNDIDLLSEYNNGNSYLDEGFDSKYVYKFNIARYLQALISGKIENDGLFLVSTYARISASRTILRGGKNSDGMKLVITYTKY